MKILMLSGDRSLAAGKRGAFYYMLEELSKYCERIDVLCPQVTSYKEQGYKKIPNSKSQIINKFKIQNSNFRKFYDNVFVWPGKKSKLAQMFYLAKKGKELWEVYKYDIVLIHEYPPFYNSLGARLLARKIDSTPVKSSSHGSTPLTTDRSEFHKVKFVVEIHHIIGYPKQADFKEKFNFWLSKLVIPKDCKRFDAVRVVNKKQVPELLKSWGVDERKLCYASSMYIDLEVFKPMNLDKKYDIVFAGRLVKNKNVEMLIEAVRILVHANENSNKFQCDSNFKSIRCAIVGDGPERKGYGLSDNIKFLGWLPGVEDVARIYNQSKLFVMPSLNEGGPRVCLEAMACGIPVVTTRVGVMMDIIRDGKNGMFCDWSAEDLADKILEMRNKEIEKLGDESRRTASCFERKEMIRRLAEEYQRIVNK